MSERAERTAERQRTEMTRLRHRVQQLESAIVCAKNEIDRVDGDDRDTGLGVLIDALPQHDWPNSKTRAKEVRHIHCPTCYESVTWYSIDGGEPLTFGYPYGADPLAGWSEPNRDGEAFCPEHRP